ncbi:hypothetical protein CcaverHIS002_0203320 [Cutaneotrichosporon cavernicola]|uniref:Origin recognition complex subunit 4 n=1 Tax=Cutaneotrichosporon cavernicola TaxID=279322 RepID=A0AA48KY36_9TREE|nr:uncharacterized protein CcaverHIS019_0203310 [Cutaneotrichosporon cavernicola]BEI81172.1 hypothetical protein CcaverHIS002_0203320 [Cutaneotrichosporon cavernicola]BEI88969.1 hypothetical protein CcaverHIS019_0203310 [Cutaneotrichosporon cavernicola]BEI96746.1 hypothetical protein CcaverHIS631_0203350 [Cutaneotrichosporon cavernicola]BEJ04518.1 hypothetical protein CcaverHIS641_0203350 [Cutaneotrichosporon cavernicola]
MSGETIPVSQDEPNGEQRRSARTPTKTVTYGRRTTTAATAQEIRESPKAAKPRAAPKAKATPARTTPTPVKQETTSHTPSKGEEEEETPKAMPARPRTPAKKDDETPRSGKRVAASLAAVRSAKKPRTSLPSFDTEAFGSPTGDLSSDVFRANERLRRQREARNFTFEGDAHAPRTTRSGRVVATRDYGRDDTEDTEDTERDEYGGLAEPEEPEVEDDGGLRLDLSLPISRSESPSVTPLPASARQHVLRMLSTLTGTEREWEPSEKEGEKKNEALQGLVALLCGTVERGEGNSALVTGPRGVGKTRTVERALRLLPTGKNAPIVVRLSGHAQTDDRRAIREIGRQIAEGEGRAAEDEDEPTDADAGDAAYAPTTLPSHLLALLTTPSPRAIIIVIDEFDLFTEHARQALLYCLLDVVQSVQTGPVERTPRGLAVIGLTARVDTLLLLEKRVKSRFSHRVWRISSPLAPGERGWRQLLRATLIPWDEKRLDKDRAMRQWQEDWAFAVDMLLEHDTVSANLERLAGLTTDVRLLYRPFVAPVAAVLGGRLDFLSVPGVAASVRAQLELGGWSTGPQTAGRKLGAIDIAAKLRGLPAPALGILIVAKHLAYAGRTEFSLAQVEDEYARFARSRLVGSGRARWPLALLRRAFHQCRALGLLAPAGPASAGPRFAKVRAALPVHDVVAFFRNDGGQALGPELAGWGKMSGGHV